MKRQPIREAHNHDRTWKNHRRPIRLLLEPLEARRLLAGLNVSVFVDQDGSRTADAADTAATRRVVFLDLNNNGQQDFTDPVAFTNDRGVATFEGIPAGDYAVGIAAGNAFQTQSFPVRVDELTTNIGPASKVLVGSADLTQVWAFDGDGKGQLLTSDASSPNIQLGGPIVSSITKGGEAWIVTRNGNSSSGTRLTQFNLTTGQQTTAEVRGLNGRVIDKLIQAGSEVVTQLSGNSGIELSKLTLVDGMPTIGASTPFPKLVAVAGSADQLAVIEYQSQAGFANTTIQMQPFATKLSILSLKDLAVVATTSLPQAAKEVSVTADGRFVLAAYAAGGVVVLDNNSELTTVATLAEATSPLLAQANDGRFVTGNSTNAFEFIVWDANTWQPSGRTRIASSAPTSLTSANAISQVVVADNGDRLLATGLVGTVASQLAQATTAPVSVPTNGIASVQLGVRVTGGNRAPTSSPVAAAVVEDNSTSGQLRSQLNDADGDTLWFDVARGPSHGSLRVGANGEWSYQPAANFSGTDRAVVRVFDGQAFSDVALTLNVTPVNDPPQELRIEVLTVPENVFSSDTAIELGYATVFDVDQGARYVFSTPDPRFQVRNGRIYLAPGAKLDFEAEPTVKLDVIATEDAISGYQITTTATLSIADINEPPTGVRILNSSVPENAAGATVGEIKVEDPDGANRFEYVLSDPRFFIENGLLKLNPGVELDFEDGQSIALSITVSDSGGQSVTQPIVLSVTDQNDAPTSLDLQLQPIEDSTPGAVVGTISVNDQDGKPTFIRSRIRDSKWLTVR